MRFRFYVVSILASLTFLWPLSSWSQNNATALIDSAAAEVISIALPEISTETKRLNDKIKRSDEYLLSLVKLESFESTLTVLEEKILSKEEALEKRNMDKSNIRSTKEQRDWWIRKGKELDKVEVEMIDVFSNLESYRELLKKEELRWTKTLQSIQDDSLSESVGQNIGDNISRINIAIKRITDTTNVGLEITNQVLRLREEIITYTSELESLKQDQLSGIFDLNQSPIWSRDSLQLQDTVTTRQILKLEMSDLKAEIRKMVEVQRSKIIGHFIFGLLIMALLIYLHSNYQNWEIFKRESLIPTTQFIKRPFFSTAFLSIFISFWWYHNLPVGLAEILILACIIPLLFILPQIVPKSFHVIIFLLAIVFSLEQINSILSDSNYAKRWIMLVQQVVAIYGFFRIIQQYRKNSTRTIKANTINTVFIPLVAAALILLLTATFGNIRGNTAYAVFITRAISISSIAFFVFYVMYLMTKGALTLLLFGNLSQQLNMIRLHKDVLLKYHVFFMKVIVTFLWIKLVLNQFGVYTPFVEYLGEIADYSWEFGNLSITLGHLVDAIVVMTFAWYLGAVIKSIIKDEVLPRFHLKRGLSDALGITTRYFVLTFGFFLAIASLGIDLEKLGFIAGALSVGIGFGLQNIVGNFISGLILLFERPIVPGDLILLGTIDGEVVNIGLRSSIVRTWDGAEVIIPNMDLISKQVTNLTLSDKKRRREFIFESEKDKAPREIIEALQKAISRHESVLSEPTPQVLFKGEIRNYYRFRVLFWVTGNVLVMDSEISMVVSEELSKLGVKMAIPLSKVDLEERKTN